MITANTDSRACDGGPTMCDRGETRRMLQELFRIPGTQIWIHGYGLMLVIGFLLAVQLAKALARRSRIDPEIFVNAGLIALVAGVVGARLSHVLENFGQYTDPHRSVRRRRPSRPPR